MGHITIRSSDEVDAVIERVKGLMGEVRTSHALVQLAMRYEAEQEQIRSLRMELKRAQEQNEKYRHAINNFKAAHNALIDIT